MTVYIAFFCIIACILLSGFFSASEMSFSSCNRLRLQRLADEGNNHAKRTLSILERYDNLLSTILVGNNLVNIAASSAGSVLAILLLGESYTWLVTAVITILIIIFGETIPKISAKKQPTQMALRYAGPIHFLSIIFKPITFVVVSLVNLISGFLKGESAQGEDNAADELHTIIDTAENEEVIDEDASDLVNAAIDFSDKSASEIMTAAIQDNEGGKIIGTKTYGKGVIQIDKSLPDGAGYKITIMQYFSPDGHTIHEQGITPDIEVEGEDEQLEKAEEQFK